MKRETLPTARIPLATYRLQFNRQFNFAAARGVVTYLHDLGISDLYASPIFAAREGSPHGYDIVDHNTLNRELGTEEEYGELCGELGRLGMGQIMDFVPNHMCIESSANSRWMDVLENGPSSLNAYFFDIDWEPMKKELRNKVLLPLLAGQYGNVLEKGEITLGFGEGAFFACCGDIRLPLEPTTYLQLLKHRMEEFEETFPADSPHLLELLSIITSLEHLPPTTEQDPDKREERYREKDIVKKRLARLCEKSPEIAGFIEENVRIFNGARGEPRSFDLLDRLLREQVYRLSFWRVATEEINYRRFFDINGLGAIRMEDPLVFRETHHLLFRLIREGKVTGVRVDHIDGLYDPFSYLHRLQKGCFVQLLPSANGGLPDDGEEAGAGLASGYDEATAADPSFKPLYVIGEKILLKGERLPEEWPIFSTTGYDFLNTLNGIFVDTDNARAFDRIYGRFVRGAVNFPDTVYDKKKLVMQVAMSGEINTLGHQLNAITEKDRLTRDFTLNSLTRAIAEVIACFPVYRTYTNSWPVREKDSQYIEEAVARAKRKNPAISASIFDFLRDLLLLRFPDRATEGTRLEWLHFVMKFQQITGPVMAKGVEDTAFYVYNRLVSLNEVGGVPDRFGTPLDTFHGQNLERLKSFSHAISASATHDSKRGEDVRARLNALSEIPDKWWKALVNWRRITRKRRKVVEGETVPSRNEEYLLYQTLVGAWPTGPWDEAATAAFRERVTDYMTKAVREAKLNSSWINPNTPYEDALASFMGAILADGEFLKYFRPFQESVARLGMFTSLSQTLLKITSPGVPDFYQGTELWDLTLVDPDNRRPVDFGQRREALAGLARREKEIGRAGLARELLNVWEDGRIKLYVTSRALRFRGENRELFEKGEYLPLEVPGEKARHVCVFARRINGKSTIVAAPRFDVVYFPPIHPIGRTNRKGRNNAPVAEEEDPGSPWAIGSAEGGHKSVHPRLGTLEDFESFITKAKERGLLVAMDIAFQCSPDHPYVREHPEWFRWRPAGTVQYAENPPKKYEDIIPFDFECAEWQALWEELRSVFLFWIKRGVSIFRVDNPHTKPFPFWEWVIREVRREHPETIFLSEAFTRPKVMYRLAKLGFSQSYTYFSWRNTRWELEQYMAELNGAEVREFFRPNFWPNTPDILPEFLQYGGRPAFAVRFLLAATLSASYGIYGPPFELLVADSLPGKEEYLDSEKYEIRCWDWDDPRSMRELISRVNRIRRENTALQTTWNARFCETDNDNIICYLKMSEDRSNILMVAVNLDPFNRQEGSVRLPLEELGTSAGHPYLVHDLLSDERQIWHGERNRVALDVRAVPGKICRLRPRLRRENDFDYYM